MKLLESKEFLNSLMQEIAEKVKDPNNTIEDIECYLKFQLGIVHVILEITKKELLKIRIDQMTEDI